MKRSRDEEEKNQSFLRRASFFGPILEMQAFALFFSFLFFSFFFFFVCVLYGLYG